MGVADTNTSVWLRSKHTSQVCLCLMRHASAVMCIVNENIKICQDCFAFNVLPEKQCNRGMDTHKKCLLKLYFIYFLFICLFATKCTNVRFVTLGLFIDVRKKYNSLTLHGTSNNSC